VNEPF
jgi:hypothetical protein